MLCLRTSGGGTAPNVTLQPASQTRCAGSSVSFTSAAGGTPAPTVQWQLSTNGGSNLDKYHAEQPTPR